MALSFALFLAAETGLVLHGDAWGVLLAAMATGLITVFLVLGNPPIWVDLLGIPVGFFTLRLAFYRRNHKRERVIRDRTSAIAELRHSEARQNERTD